MTRNIWPLRTLFLAPIVAVLPILVYGVVVLYNVRGHVLLGGDLALLEMWTRSAEGLDAELGPYSRFGWNHPGPIVFYMFVPFYAASGGALGGLALAAVSLLAASLAAAVVVVARLRGRAGAAVATITVLAFIAVTGSAWFDNMWNPVMVIGPVIFAGVAAGGVVEGRAWLLPAVVLSCSFSVQTHLGSAPATTVFLLTAVAGAVVHARREMSAWQRPLIAAASVAVLLWIPPAIEQFTDNPGNVVAIVESASQEADANHSFREVLDVVSSQLTFSSIDIVDDSLQPGATLSGSFPLKSVWLGVLLATAVFCCRLNARSQRWFEAALCGSGAAAAVAVVVGLSQVAGPLRPYLTFTAASVGFVLHLGIALTAIQYRPRIAMLDYRLVMGTIGALSLLLTASVIVRGSTDNIVVHRQDREGAASAVSAVLDVIPSGSEVSIVVQQFDRWPDAVLIVNEIERSGSNTTTLPNLLWMFGDERSTTGCERFQLTFSAPSDAATSDATPDATETFVFERTRVVIMPLTPKTSC